MSELRELNDTVFIREAIYECNNCGCDVTENQHKNTCFASEDIEHFCNQDCENEFVNKNTNGRSPFEEAIN